LTRTSWGWWDMADEFVKFQQIASPTWMVSCPKCERTYGQSDNFSRSAGFPASLDRGAMGRRYRSPGAIPAVHASTSHRAEEETLGAKVPRNHRHPTLASA
jgi:hypothetical protein